MLLSPLRGAVWPISHQRGLALQGPEERNRAACNDISFAIKIVARFDYSPRAIPIASGLCDHILHQESASEEKEPPCEGRSLHLLFAVGCPELCCCCCCCCCCCHCWKGVANDKGTGEILRMPEKQRVYGLQAVMSWANGTDGQHHRRAG